MNPSITSSGPTNGEALLTMNGKSTINNTLRRVLLGCGIISSLLYVAMNIIGAMFFEGYSSVSQTVSELSAIGAPSRALWVPLGVLYSLLMVAFGWGVRQSASNNRPLRVVGALFVAFGLIGLYWPPMHLRGMVFSLTDAMHIVYAIITILLMMLAIGFGTVAFGKYFRFYSIATLVIFFIFGTLTGMDGPRIAANLSTPWVGVWERINIGAFLLWVIILATILLRKGKFAVTETR
jgi:hypothetical protein